MTTYIKIMSLQKLPDSDPTKDFTILTLADGDSFRFESMPINRRGANSMEDVLRIKRLNANDWEDTPFLGNIYIMNAAGKTIATRNSKYSEQPPVAEAQAGGQRLSRIMASQDDNQRGATASISLLTARNIGIVLEMSYSVNTDVLRAARKFVEAKSADVISDPQ